MRASVFCIFLAHLIHARKTFLTERFLVKFSTKPRYFYYLRYFPLFSEMRCNWFVQVVQLSNEKLLVESSMKSQPERRKIFRKLFFWLRLFIELFSLIILIKRAFELHWQITMLWSKYWRAMKPIFTDK